MFNSYNRREQVAAARLQAVRLARAEIANSNLQLDALMANLEQVPPGERAAINRQIEAIEQIIRIREFALFDLEVVAGLRPEVGTGTTPKTEAELELELKAQREATVERARAERAARLAALGNPPPQSAKRLFPNG